MIRLQAQPLNTIEDAWSRLQTAIELEFSTLPPYLYAKFSILPGKNEAAAASLGQIVGEEMIHLCLACNVMNAIGGRPDLTQAPEYPGKLPGDIGPPNGKPIEVHLLPFSPEAMAQGMAIEQPEKPIKIQTLKAAAAKTETIGQFYGHLDAFLKTLPASAWIQNRNQIDDDQFFPGQLFAINSYEDAHRAISRIVSEGEGSQTSPLDFQNEVAHYYRFEEIFRDKVLTKQKGPPPYRWGPEAFGVVWEDVYPAIADPQSQDFSKQPKAAQAAQTACDVAYTALIDALQQAVTGWEGALGNAVRAMFDLRMAAIAALNTPIDPPPGKKKAVAGPAFRYLKQGAAS